MNRSDLLSAAGDGESVCLVFRHLVEAAETFDTAEIRAFLVNAASPCSAVEVNAPTIRSHHGEVLALLVRRQCFDCFLSLLRCKPAACSAVLQAVPVKGMISHQNSLLLIAVRLCCDKPSQWPAGIRLFKAEGS